MSATNAHDGAQSVSSAQTSGAALGDESAQARSEGTRDSDRVVATESDHATRHADRGDGTGSGPNPVPWAPSAGMRTPMDRPATGGTIRIANPYNQRNQR